MPKGQMMALLGAYRAGNGLLRQGRLQRTKLLSPGDLHALHAVDLSPVQKLLQMGQARLLKA